MRVVGEKTQLLVLSQIQWVKDSDLSIRVVGQVVQSGPQLKLLGDWTLHFGPHCRVQRESTRPKLHQLKELTGHSWGLKKCQLHTIAQGYVHSRAGRVRELN